MESLENPLPPEPSVSRPDDDFAYDDTDGLRRRVTFDERPIVHPQGVATVKKPQPLSCWRSTMDAIQFKWHRWELWVDEWFTSERARRRCMCGLSLFWILLVMIGLMYVVRTAQTVHQVHVSDERPDLTSHRETVFVDEHHPRTVLRHGTSNVTCDMLTFNIFSNTVTKQDVQRHVRLALDEDNETICVAAPAVGLSYRYMGLRVNDTILHMFNPTVQPLTEMESVIRQLDPNLYPLRTEKAIVVRRNEIRIGFVDGACQPRQLDAFYETAWELQTCVHLLDGLTLYDETLTNEREHPGVGGPP